MQNTGKISQSIMPSPTRITRWRRRRQRNRPSAARTLLRLTAVLLITAVLGVGGLMLALLTGSTAVYAAITDDLPSFDQIAQSQTSVTLPGAAPPVTTIYAWRDAAETEKIPILEIRDPLDGSRPWLPLSDLPPVLLDAAVMAADPDFWQRENLSLTAVAQALAGDGQPAPLAQQVARDNLLSGRAGFRGRLDEILLTRRLYASYSRQQILEWYLNTAYYGRLAFGIEAAARVYFDKPAAELTLAEAAMLAPLPLAPTQNPLDDRETAVANQIALLTALADAGRISRDQLAAAQFTPLAFAPILPDDGRVIAPHFALYVQAELLARFGPQAILSGLEVTTSLNLAWQAQAECVARAQIGRLSGQVGPVLPADERAGCQTLAFLPSLAPEDLGLDRQVSNAAIVALDAETAAIKIMVGNLQFGQNKAGLFNIAAAGRRQPGTMLTPITALTALSQGYTPATMVLDVPVDFGDITGGADFAPQNEDGRFLGPMRLRQAVGGGLTVPAVQVMGWVGADKVARTGRSLGIATLDPAQHNALTLAVGGGGVTPLDMAYAFGVINNMGVMLGQPGADAAARPLDPAAVLQVTDSGGRVLYEYDQPQRREIVTSQLAFLLNDMLSDRAARCDGMGCPNVLELPGNRPAAVAAGSANDFRDAWTIGYTPQLVTAVWVGNGDNRPMAGVTGREGAAPIWQAFMTWAMQDAPVAVWTQPPGLVERSVCDLSGFLASPICPAVSELFVPGTEPLHPDRMYRELAVNRENGRLATLDTPPELAQNRVFVIYPQAAADWVEANDIPQPPDEYDTLTGAGGSSDTAAIRSPGPLSYVNGQIVITGTAAGLDFAYYRLAYFAGLTPADLRTITDTVSISRENGRLGVWDVSNLDGLVTLLLTVVDGDGRFQEVSVPLTVDNTPPVAAIQSPTPNQSFPSGTDAIPIRVSATDNIEVDFVLLYLDGAQRPFTSDSTPPFTLAWPVSAAGCHTITAVAVDLAGNQTVSAAVPFCIVE